MTLRRGAWHPEAINKAAAIKTGRFGAKPAITTNGMSNSESHMASRKTGTDPVTVEGISEHRREELIRATDTTSRSGQAKNAPMPLVVNSNSYKSTQELKEKYGGMSKTAGIISSDGRFGTPGGSTVRLAPEVYSPLFQIANLQLPRDRITMNAWNRNFYDTHPLVHNCINLHATYPINKIHIKCKDQKIEQFFNNMAEEMDLMGTLQAVALEFWKMGEVFPYAELDEQKGSWKSIVIQNPDYIHVKTSVLSGQAVISMRPDAALQRLVTSNNPADVQLRNQIDEQILYHIRKGNNIPLDNFHVSHLKMLSSAYDVHGTALIVSIYKDLMLYDKLRESKFAQADNLVNPITLVKVGGASEGEYHPTGDDLEKWRQTFEAAQYDKDFKIITHAGVTVERVGAGGQIIDIQNDMNQIIDNILYGLMVPKAVITQDGAAFNSASIGLEVLKQRYESFRNMMAQWLTKKIFAPISEIQEFYEYVDGEKKLIVPEIEWNKMILYDMDNYINILNGLVGNNIVSKTTLFKSLGLNVEEERRQVKEEMIHQAIMAKEAEILQGLHLGALRALKPDEDIIEPTEAPLPGTAGAGAEESGIPGAGGMGMGAPGGMPPLGGPGGGLGAPLGGPGGPGGPLGGPPPGGGPAGPGGPPPGPGGGELGGGGPAGGGAPPAGGAPPPAGP
jgi:hypothetical protein